MSDEDSYLDEPFRPVRARIERPVSELEKRLKAEAEEIERRALQASQTGKRSAELGHTFTNGPTGQEWTSIKVFGPGPSGSYSAAMPKEMAERFVEITNDAHKHLDVIIDAYVANDDKRALKHVRELFRTLRKVRQVGRPPEPYKEEVMTKTLAWLRTQDPTPRQARVREFIETAAWDLDEQPCDGTTKNWARETLKTDRQRRQKGQ